jgi:hypothetical protein
MSERAVRRRGEGGGAGGGRGGGGGGGCDEEEGSVDGDEDEVAASARRDSRCGLSSSACMRLSLFQCSLQRILLCCALRKSECMTFHTGSTGLTLPKDCLSVLSAQVWKAQLCTLPGRGMLEVCPSLPSHSTHTTDVFEGVLSASTLLRRHALARLHCAPSSHPSPMCSAAFPNIVMRKKMRPSISLSVSP